MLSENHTGITPVKSDFEFQEAVYAGLAFGGGRALYGIILQDEKSFTEIKTEGAEILRPPLSSLNDDEIYATLPPRL